MAEKKTKKYVSADSGAQTAAPEKKERKVKEKMKKFAILVKKNAKYSRSATRVDISQGRSKLKSARKRAK